MEVQANQQMDAEHYYNAGDMNEVRDAYLRCGYVPKQLMKDMLKNRMLKVHDFGGRAVTIHSVPADHDELYEFTRLVGLPYRGEGLPTVTFKTLLKFLRPSRKDPSTTLRKQICDDQKGKCAKCGSACKLEIDHIHKISTDPLNKNGRDNLQGLCAECHQAKTLAQTSDVEYNPMMSYFNDHTWSNFVMSERPKQQMYRSTTIDERMNCQQVDVIRCRRNILAHSRYP